MRGGPANPPEAARAEGPLSPGPIVASLDFVTPCSADVSRSVTRSVVGLLAIPLASVSTAALLGDAASSSDPARLAMGVVALIMGTFVGLAIAGLARVTASGFCMVAAAIVAWDPRDSDWIVTPAASCFVFVPALAPIRASRTAPIRRRGPPVGLG